LTLGVGDLHLPATPLEAVMDDAGAVHRLDRGADRHRAIRLANVAGEARQAVGVRRRRAGFEPLAPFAEQAEVKTLTAEIQTGIHDHENGPPPARSIGSTPEPGTEEALLHDIQRGGRSGRE
jgi:hypothetical protein